VGEQRALRFAVPPDYDVVAPSRGSNNRRSRNRGSRIRTSMVRMLPPTIASSNSAIYRATKAGRGCGCQVDDTDRSRTAARTRATSCGSARTSPRRARSDRPKAFQPMALLGIAGSRGRR
jgi:hypothetical protein